MKLIYLDADVLGRRRFADALSGFDEIEIVGTASRANLLLRRLEQVNTDVVALDHDVPDMPAIELIAQVVRSYTALFVVVLVPPALSQARVDALRRAGAMCIVVDPSDANRGWADALRRACRRAARSTPSRIPEAANSPPPPVSAPAPAERPSLVTRMDPGHSVSLLAIGSSTGGPQALMSLVPQLPLDLPVPVVLVQHMPPIFTRRLAEQLDKVSELSVIEAEAGITIEPGYVYIAPGGHHLKLRRVGARAVTELDDGPLVNSCRPSVDVMFESAVEAYGGGVLAAVLTGMGADGLRGSEKITAAGGVVMVQDEQTSVVWGMPSYVAKAGLATKVLPLGEIAPALVRRCRSSTRQKAAVMR